MGKPPYEDPDTLDLMRADATQVELVPIYGLATVPSSEAATPSRGLDIPSDAVDLGGALHFHLD